MRYLLQMNYCLFTYLIRLWLSAFIYHLTSIFRKIMVESANLLENQDFSFRFILFLFYYWLIILKRLPTVKINDLNLIRKIKNKQITKAKLIYNKYLGLRYTEFLKYILILYQLNKIMIRWLSRYSRSNKKWEWIILYRNFSTEAEKCWLGQSLIQVFDIPNWFYTSSSLNLNILSCEDFSQYMFFSNLRNNNVCLTP